MMLFEKARAAIPQVEFFTLLGIATVGFCLNAAELERNLSPLDAMGVVGGALVSAGIIVAVLIISVPCRVLWRFQSEQRKAQDFRLGFAVCLGLLFGVILSHQSGLRRVFIVIVVWAAWIILYRPYHWRDDIEEEQFPEKHGNP